MEVGSLVRFKKNPNINYREPYGNGIGLIVRICRSVWDFEVLWHDKLRMHDEDELEEVI